MIEHGESNHDVRAVPPDAPECPLGGDRLNAESADLPEKRRLAVEILLRGRGTNATARMIGVDRKTLYRWRQDPAFARELDRRRRELWSDAAERLRGMLHDSLDVLDEHLHAQYDRSRFRAATAVLRISDIRKCVPVEDEE